MKHVAVLMGGPSSEREVSLRSGRACASGLVQAGYRVSLVDAQPLHVSAVLSALAPDVVFNALHGTFGEDGTVQGILEALRLPYTHSGVLASSLAMDKTLAKLVMKAAGIPVAEGRLMTFDEVMQGHPFEPPYVIKPNAEGSSVGVLIVMSGDPLPMQGLEELRATLTSGVLVERYVAGRELTCAVMGDRCLGVTEIIAADGFYDYRAKYQKGGSKHVCPAEIKPDVYQEVQSLTLRAHKALGCRGVSRADFRWDDQGTGHLVCLEVNTQPGMTETSLVPELAQHAGLRFDELVAWMVEDASLGR